VPENLRLVAWLVLRRGGDAPLRAVPDAADHFELDPRDRGLLRHLIGVEVRRRGTLRAILRHLAHRPPKTDLAAHLRLGLAQLFFLDRVPDHAAVSETVRAVTDTLGLAKGRVANAVLRRAIDLRREGEHDSPRQNLPACPFHLAEPIFRDPAEHPLLWAEDALSMPAALVGRWSRRWGQDEAFRLARLSLTEAPLSLRLVNPAEPLPEELAALDPRPGRHPAIRILPSSAAEALFASAAFAAGSITIQGETALRAAELLGAAPGERLLDLCAAPGGKTAVLAAAGAKVIASDRSPARLAPLLANMERLGLGERVSAIASDGVSALSLASPLSPSSPPSQTGAESTAALAPLSTPLFDGALVDAPCTNTGVLAQRPGARWRFGPGAEADLNAIQDRLLKEAASLVRPGGRLVYSTCSLEPAENTGRIRAFLESHPDWSLVEEQAARPASIADAAPSIGDAAGPVDGPAAGPRAGPIDGGYAARLSRSS
jgi:16S rRNA (cytosine967-C5)-methyltransferase